MLQNFIWSEFVFKFKPNAYKTYKKPKSRTLMLGQSLQRLVWTIKNATNFFNNGETVGKVCLTFYAQSFCV